VQVLGGAPFEVLEYQVSLFEESFKPPANSERWTRSTLATIYTILGLNKFSAEEHLLVTGNRIKDDVCDDFSVKLFWR
jgi:hypothetical protein